VTHTLRRWGNSLAVRIPRRLVRAAGLRDGSVVDLRFADGRIVIIPLSCLPTLERLLADVRPHNLHGGLGWSPLCAEEEVR
jgi:antitoxin MazE